MLLGTFLGRISKPRTITTPSPAPAARRTATTTDEPGRLARPAQCTWAMWSAAAGATLTLSSWISPRKHLLSSPTRRIHFDNEIFIVQNGKLV